jgi:hypothetical protein
MKQKSCRRCEKPRLSRGVYCYQHFREHQRELKEALNARKMARKAVKKAKTIQRSAKSTKNLDKLWSKRIKERAGHRCEYCGSTNYLNSHHVVRRTIHNVRWYYPNGVCLCANHHMFSNEFAAHSTPLEFSEWIRKKRGEAWYNDLCVQRRENHTREYWREYLKDKLG